MAVGSQAMPAELLELHQKLRYTHITQIYESKLVCSKDLSRVCCYCRQAQEAREKLAELQQMISLLQEPVRYSSLSFP